jgi:uncharacterized protein YutE (UPF0331/DUF86 family)
MHEAGAFSNEFVEKLKEMAKFRNRLVHIYWEVDDEVIFDILNEDIQDFKKFVKMFMEFISKNADKKNFQMYDCF